MSNTLAASLRQRMSGFGRHLGTGLTVGVVVFAAACSSESIVAPSAIGRPMMITSVPAKKATGLLRDVRLTGHTSTWAMINKDGGSVVLAEAGLKVTIPAGAITKGNVKITLTAYKGKAVAYEFEPHGLVFAKPVTVEQSLIGTNWMTMPNKPALIGGYFKLADQIDMETGAALLDETFSTLLNVTKLTFQISHFSGYMVSMD